MLFPSNPAGMNLRDLRLLQTLTKLLWLLASSPWRTLTGRHREFFPSTHHQWTKTTGSHSSWQAFLRMFLILQILQYYKHFVKFWYIHGITYKPRQSSVSAVISILFPGSVEDRQNKKSFLNINTHSFGTTNKNLQLWVREIKPSYEFGSWNRNPIKYHVFPAVW